MAKEYRVVALCNGGHGLYWLEEYVGTRHQCFMFVKSRARAGRHTATTFITSRSFDDWQRLHPTD